MPKIVTIFWSFLHVVGDTAVSNGDGHRGQPQGNVVLRNATQQIE
jgi:hypothetical protein